MFLSLKFYLSVCKCVRVYLKLHAAVHVCVVYTPFFYAVRSVLFLFSFLCILVDFVLHLSYGFRCSFLLLRSDDLQIKRARVCLCACMCGRYVCSRWYYLEIFYMHVVNTNRKCCKRAKID